MAENTKNENQTQEKKEEEIVKEKNSFLKGTWRRMKNGIGWMAFGLGAGALGMYAVMSGRKQSEETGDSNEESEETAEESSEESSEE